MFNKKRALNYLRHLIAKEKITKWGLSKSLDVSYTTLHHWLHGHYEPGVEGTVKLKKYISRNGVILNERYD